MHDGSQPQSLASRYRAALHGNPLSNAAHVARGLEQVLTAGLLELGLPGRGRTRARFDTLSELAAIDLSLVRLAEGHVDAHAILHELGVAPRLGSYGVWAAEGSEPVVAERRDDGYVLRGCKRYASGASSLTHALVTAKASDGPRLFDVSLNDPRIRKVSGSWRAVGMASSDSLDVWFDEVWVPGHCVVGGPRSYLDRASFWHGGVGVAACWYGGAVGCIRLLARTFANKPADEHASAHVGHAYVHWQMMRTLLEQAAVDIDAEPYSSMESARRRALVVRSAVEQGVTAVLEHTHRALGPSAMVFDAEHARRAADLPVYVRQHHGERDLAELGRSLTAGAAWP